MTLSHRLLAVTLILCASGCASVPPQGNGETGRTPEHYYSEARKAQASGDHSGAIASFTALEEHYPLSPYAQLAPLEIAYARYKLQQYPQAATETERFITSHPDHANLDYAYYLKGLIRRDQGTVASADAGAADISDSGHVRAAFAAFATVVRDFPDSGYRDSALKQMSLLRNLMARQELHAVRQQLAEGQQEAAVKHAKYIVEQYPKTPAAREALELITSSASVSTPSLEIVPVSATAAPQATSDSGPDAPRREAWLLQQDPGRFTLQIVGTSSEAALTRYIEQHGLRDSSAYYRRTHNNRDWYSLLYGNFKGRSDAIDAAERLKHELGLDNIWIRRFDDIQSSILESDNN